MIYIILVVIIIEQYILLENHEILNTDISRMDMKEMQTDYLNRFRSNQNITDEMQNGHDFLDRYKQDAKMFARPEPQKAAESIGPFQGIDRIYYINPFLFLGVISHVGYHPFSHSHNFWYTFSVEPTQN